MCEEQTTKKYTSRKSPPYPANECKESEKIGNDGKMYKSVGNKNGVHRWILLKSAENEFLKNFEKKPKSKSQPKEKSPKGACKENQIINPATGRCVLKTGPIGKKLLGVSKSPKSPGKKSESY